MKQTVSSSSTTRFLKKMRGCLHETGSGLAGTKTMLTTQTRQHSSERSPRRPSLQQDGLFASWSKGSCKSGVGIKSQHLSLPLIFSCETNINRTQDAKKQEKTPWERQRRKRRPISRVGPFRWPWKRFIGLSTSLWNTHAWWIQRFQHGDRMEMSKPFAWFCSFGGRNHQSTSDVVAIWKTPSWKTLMFLSELSKNSAQVSRISSLIFINRPPLKRRAQRWTAEDAFRRSPLSTWASYDSSGMMMVTYGPLTLEPLTESAQTNNLSLWGPELKKSFHPWKKKYNHYMCLQDSHDLVGFYQ